jgi:concanavalin A-like lectin/glucanase superfamily protein/PA14 domain-containing protein/Big-like domain-containing protein/parallel beta helix pectate lyase-like protein
MKSLFRLYGMALLLIWHTVLAGGGAEGAKYIKANIPAGAYASLKNAFYKEAMKNAPNAAAKTFLLSPPSPPQIFSVRISSGEDDGDESTYNGIVCLHSPDLALGSDNGTAQIVGLRFPGITIPQGAIITNAYVEFEADEIDYSTTYLELNGQAIDNAPAFDTSDYNISSRSKTSATVFWNDVSAWNAVNAKHKSPNLALIIQEIVDRPGWASGNSLAIIVEGTGERTAESYNGEPAAAPLLVVEYDDGTGGGGYSGCLPSLNNPDFENGETGWSDDGTSVMLTSDAFSGANAIEVSGNGAYFYQNIPVTPGQTYYITVAAKTLNNPNWAEIFVTWKTAEWNDIQDVIQPVYNSQYQVLEIIDKAPSNAAYMTIGGYKEGHSSKKLLLDDFCIKTGPAPGGYDYDLECGCEDNMLPNGDCEVHNSSLAFNYSIGGNPVARMGPFSNKNALPPWTPGLSSPYMFCVDDTQGSVNNPEGDHFVILPGNGDSWVSNLNFSSNLNLIDGETYEFCFYAASFAPPLNGSGLPTGSGSAPPHSGIVFLEFQYKNSGIKTVSAWATPSSESWNNLSWRKYTYLFTYSSADPIVNFFFTNVGNNTGTCLDAVTLSRVDCSAYNSTLCPLGSIDFERWTNISGVSVDDLITKSDFPNKPDIAGKLTTFQGQINEDNNYGTRVRGYLHPQETGTYQFNVTGNDNVRLFLSIDSSFENKIPFAEIPGWTNVSEHNKYPQQTSTPVTLQAGQKYFIELFHKEASGSDHFQVYWKTPSNSAWTIIDGAFLSAYACGNSEYDNMDAVLVTGHICEEIHRYNALTGVYRDELISNGLTDPRDMILGPDGLLYISSYDGNNIAKYDPYTGSSSGDFTSTNVNGPLGLTFGPDGHLYVANYKSDNVVKFDGATGDFLGVFASGNGLDHPRIGLTFGPDGHLYVANKYQKVLRFDGTTGDFMDVFISLPKASDKIGDIVFDKYGNWFVAYSNKDRIEKYSPNGNLLGQFSVNGSIEAAMGMTIGPDGHLYVVCKSENKVFRFNTSEKKFMNVFVNSGNGLKGAYSVLFIPKPDGGCTALMHGGTIDGGVTICAPADVPAFTSGYALGSSLVYQWQQSTGNGESWTDIDEAEGEVYDPGIISQTTRYRRRAWIPGCGRYYFSNEVAVAIGVCEICYDGMDNDGDGLADGKDPDCGAIYVTTTAGISDGDVSSVAALINNPGSDGEISLREAISASQSAASRTSYHVIGFDMNAGDPRHYYYADDGVPNQMTRTKLTITTAIDDSDISDIDPDYPHSFWSLQTSSPLPFLRDNVMVDGYSLAETQMNGQPFGGELNTILRIELTGPDTSALVRVGGSAMSGPLDSLNSVVVRGLSIHNAEGSAVIVEGAETDGRAWFYGNFIGVDPAGLLEMSGSDHTFLVKGTNRLLFIGSDSDGRNDEGEINLISGATGTNGAIGFLASTQKAYVRGNYFGIGKDGSKNVGGNDGQAVADSYGLGNIFENNLTGFGERGFVFDNADGYIIRNNFFGTDPAGSKSFNFTSDGGSCHACTGMQLEGNIIANAGGSGFAISETSNSIFKNNKIYGNGAAGLGFVDINDDAAKSLNNLIQGNELFNNQVGVQIAKDADYQTITGNSIHDNNLLGIDLTQDFSPDGPEINDLEDDDDGPNRTINSPVLTPGSITGNMVNFTFSIDVHDFEAGSLDGYRIEFFANNTLDSSGHGEGEIYLDYLVITNDVSDYPVTLAIPPGIGGPDYWISAISVEIEDMSNVGIDDIAAYGASSEFSNIIYAHIKEICDNGVDDDGDGLADCNDSDCTPLINSSITHENCDEGGGGAIELTVMPEGEPFTFYWDDMVESAHWTFENNTTDASGNNNNQNGGHGSISYSNDAMQAEMAAMFDGQTYIRYSVDGGFMESQFSKLVIAMWIKPAGLNGKQTLFEEGGKVNGIAMRLNGNELEAAVRNQNKQFTAGSHTFPNDGLWHHVALTFEEGNLTLYLDGVPGTTVIASYSTVNNHSGNGGLGYYDNGSGFGNGNGNRYTGLMDDVRYYYQQDVSAEYVAGLARNDGSRTELSSGAYVVTVKANTGCAATADVYVLSGSNFTAASVIADEETGCGNFDPATITVIIAPSGGSGGAAEYKWEQSIDGGVTWTEISGATSDSYNPAPITQTMLYRQATRSVPCSDWLYSNIVIKEIAQNYLDAGAITGEQSNCGAFHAGLVSGTMPSSPNPPVSFKVEPPVSGSGNGATYTVTIAEGEIRYLDVTGSNVSKVEVKGGPDIASYTIQPFTELTAPIDPNNGKPHEITEFNIFIADDNVAPECKWEQSTDGGVTWELIAGAAGISYRPGPMSQTTQIRRAVRRFPCPEWLYSEVVVKTIIDNYSGPGQIFGNEENCSSYDPNVISHINPPTGGSGGSLVYQWQKSDNDGLSWTDIPGAVSQSYDPGTITQTILFRRGATRSPCSEFIYTDEVIKLVTVNFTDAGAIGGKEAICGTYDPAPIISYSPAGGGQDGEPQYQWQQSNDGGNTWPDISDATEEIYDPSVVGETTHYRRRARRLPCQAWINSNTVTKTVKTVPYANIDAYPGSASGYLCEKTGYVFESADAGDGAVISWNFGSFSIPGTANGKGPHVVSFDVPDTPIFSLAIVTLTANLDGCIQSDSKTLNIRPEIGIDSVTVVNPDSCSSDNGSISISATYPAGSDVQASIDSGVTWQSGLTFGNLAAGVYDVQIRYGNGDCYNSIGMVTISEPFVPEVAISISNSEICTGQSIDFQAFPANGNPALTWNFGSGASPGSANGQGPHTVAFADGGIKNIYLIAQDSGCTLNRDTAVIAVSALSSAGSIIGDENLCSISDPAIIIPGASPVGGFGGTLEYQWQFRQSAGPDNWDSWQDTGGANSADYDPDTINAKTQYRRKTRLAPCQDWQYTNAVTKFFSTIPMAEDDTYESACPGFWYVNNVSGNDMGLQNANYQLVAPPTNGVVDIDPDGEFVYTPNSTFCGFDQFIYLVCNDGSACCDTATVTIDLNDYEVPTLQNVPADMAVNCDDEMPLPPLVDAWENCQSVSLGFDQASTQGVDSCSINNYVLSRIWTAVDYCGNYVLDYQNIVVEDKTAPDIFRVYTLPNGKRLVAGVMENVTNLWKTIRFPIQFSSPPIVLSQVVTENDGQTVVTRLRNVSTTQFQLRLQEEENADGYHLEESVAWIAIEKGVQAGDFAFETGDMLISSLTSNLSFQQSYASPPGIFASVLTFNENNPCNVRYENATANSVKFNLSEEASFDSEVNHGYETIGYLIAGDTGNISNASGEVFGETGKLTLTHNLISVNLQHNYHNPVVVVGPIGKEDASPATVRVRNVTANSFGIYIEEWDYLNGTHAPEQISYMVVEGSIPFDAAVDCHNLPAAPQINTELFAVDNCDNTISITFSQSSGQFSCSDNTLHRTWSAYDECGNTSTLIQTLTLTDTIPPNFTAPEEVVIYCTENKDDLSITGDVSDEYDNCAQDIEAVYADTPGNLANGCEGFITRIWTLSDLCGNTTNKNQIIQVINGNDTDGDGTPDALDLDDDNDGIPDVDETADDRDGDGIPNHKDLDSDNDGIPDIIEAGFIDKNGDGVVDNIFQIGWDDDEDGLAAGFDGDDANTNLSASDIFENSSADADSDGVPNFWDLDSDNDGIPDIIEAGGVDANGDGIMDYPVSGDPLSMEDEDNDGFASFYDPDEDGLFGVDNANEPLISFNNLNFLSGQLSYNPDFDEDGIPDFLDLDSDNDGIPGIIEEGGVDTNGDGRFDMTTEFEDANNDGFHDNCVTYPFIRTEPDGPVKDGRPDDADGNGSSYLTGDLDNDNLPNYRDPDSDGDGISDLAETGNLASDSNFDGKIDAITDTNADGFHDDFSASILTDADGTVNDARPEDDSDPDSSPYESNLPDGTFGELNAQPDIDDDGDGLLNAFDSDSDSDLIPDGIEDKDHDGQMDPGETDPLDRDSDDDGLTDGLEDTNLNGIFDLGETNPLDNDTDHDLLTDGQEDLNLNSLVDLNESDPRDPCNPNLSDNCMGVKLQLKVKLQGALINNGGGNLMRDDLRAKGYLPYSEPYKNLQIFSHANEGGGEVSGPAMFSVTGPDAIVDWILVELRHGAKPDSIVATRSALLQRDGDVIMPDGDSILTFRLIKSGYYYVAVRHRNHLGVVTNETFLLSPNLTFIDFTNPATEVKGNHPRVSMNGEMALWSGDLNLSRNAVYQGPLNDVLALFIHIILHSENQNTISNFVSQGYTLTDLDMDGNSIFQGPGNDRSKLLFNVTLAVGDNSEQLTNFVLYDDLPETNQALAAPACYEDKTIPACDFDNDGIVNEPDPDDDNDGVMDINDAGPFNPLSDSDADGIRDIIETGGDGYYHIGVDTDPLEQDTDGDGMKDGVEDANKNGQADAGESDPVNPCSPLATAPLCDFDNDGIINAFDLDDDNDGVNSLNDVNDYDVDSDSDGDGLSDNFETGNDGIYNAETDSNPLNACDPNPSAGGCAPVDGDGDGYFSNYPPSHQQFDLNDENPCLPQTTSSNCSCEDEDNDGKIIICHNPWSNSPKTRKISIWLWPVHLAHGDTCGPCQE